VSGSSREVRLLARPTGPPVAGDFAVVTRPLPDPGPGEIVVRNHCFSVDPYMLGRLQESMVHMDPFELDAALDGAAVGEVVASRSADHREGDLVVHGLGWRDLALLDGGAARRVPAGRFPPSAHLGVLGMPGMTAWYGLGVVGGFRPGAVVYVSAAAGAVGSTVGQLVRYRGGTVIGSTGSPDKARWLRAELGFDHVLDHHDDLVKGLEAAAPDGIDVYFDNVGGAGLDAALTALKPGGTVVACGMIAHPLGEPVALRNLSLIVGKRLSIRGFIVSDHYDLRPRFEQEMSDLLERGAVRVVETAMPGLDAGPAALTALLHGGNRGKLVVTL